MDELIILIQQFISSDTIISKLDLQNCTDIIFKKNVLDYSKYFAERAVNEKNKKWIHYGIIAHALENVRVDSRFNMMGLSLLIDGAFRIDFCKDELIQIIQNETLEPFKTLALEFANRTRQNQRIENMGFTVNEEGRKFSYVPMN